MKKLLFVSAIILSLMSSACSSDSNTDGMITTNIEVITIGHNEQMQVEASSTEAIFYEVENSFNATVSQSGIISGRFVGETNLWLTTSRDHKCIKVVVEPKENLFQLPNVKLGQTKESVIEEFGKPNSQTENAIGYSGFAEDAPIIMFVFSNSNKLINILVLVEKANKAKVDRFLNERYLQTSDESESTLYIDGNDLSTAKLLIYSQEYNERYWAIKYGFNPITWNK